MSDTQNGMTRATRFVSISVSEPYEGVGRALATAYSATEQADLPNDMTRLLDRLDRMDTDGNEGPSRN